jgi:hypothetical protein
MAGIVVLYQFLFSSYEHTNYVFKTGEQKLRQENDSCHIYIFFGDFKYLNIRYLDILSSNSIFLRKFEWKIFPRPTHFFLFSIF